MISQSMDWISPTSKGRGEGEGRGGEMRGEGRGGEWALLVFGPFRRPWTGSGIVDRSVME